MGPRRLFSTLAGLLLMVAAHSSSHAEQARLDLGSYTIASETAFGAPEAMGERIRSVRYPADAPADATEIEIWVLQTEKADVERMRQSGLAPNVLAKTALGVQGQPDQVNKTLFLGGTAARTVYQVETPRPHELHLFQGIDPNGDHVSVLVKVFDEGASEGHLQRVGDTLRAIANDLEPK